MPRPAHDASSAGYVRRIRTASRRTARRKDCECDRSSRARSVSEKFVRPEAGSSARDITRRRLFGLLLRAGICCSERIGLTPAFAQMASSRPLTSVEPRGGAPVANFVDIGEAAGLSAKTVIGGSTQKNAILETTGGGVAIFDYDNDGWPDIFLVNGWQDGGRSALTKPTSHLYRNNHDGTFTDVTEKAGSPGRAGPGRLRGRLRRRRQPRSIRHLLRQERSLSQQRDGTFTDVTA